MSEVVKLQVQCQSTNRQLMPTPTDPNTTLATVTFGTQTGEGLTELRGPLSLSFSDPSMADKFEIGKVYTISIKG